MKTHCKRLLIGVAAILFATPAFSYINEASNQEELNAYLDSLLSSYTGAYKPYSPPEPGFFVGGTGAYSFYMLNKKEINNVGGFITLPGYEGQIDTTSTLENQGYSLGLLAGYRITPNIEAYASYQYILGGEYLFEDSNLGDGNETYTAISRGKLRSHVFLANVDYYFNSDRSIMTPYVGVGLGVALNEMQEGTQNITFLDSVRYSASVQGAKKFSPAAEGRVGVRMPITNSLNFNLFYALTYVGSFESGDTRTFDTSGDFYSDNDARTIKPYRIENVIHNRVGAQISFHF